MVASIPAEPDQSGPIIYVGQDKAGHWLVQDSGKQLEGRFISLATAMRYAQGERHMYHATIELLAGPLTPLVSFAPIQPRGPALVCAA